MARAAVVPPIERPLKQDPACTRCALAAKSETVCCRTTLPQIEPAGIFLFGEALGQTEERKGRAFVGDAGRKLNYCLQRARIRRKSLHIGNAARCRPPGNKKPSVGQLQACYPYSLYDILKHKPKVIVALGATAYSTLTGEVQNTGKLKANTARQLKHWRGFPERVTFTWDSPKGIVSHTCWVIGAYHPAACLRAWELDDLLIFDLALAKELAEGGPGLKYPETKITVVNSMDAARALFGRLRSVGRFVVDLETTGLDPHKDKTICAGFCYKDDEAHILPLLRQGGQAVWSPRDRRTIIRELTDLLEHSELIGQNLKYDTQMLRAETGIVDFRIGFDTMVAHSLVDENKPHNLTFQSQYYLRWDKYDAVMGEYYNGRMLECADVTLHRYCGHDVNATWQLARIHGQELKRQRLETAYQIQEDLIVPLADMEYRGIQGDRTRLMQLATVYRKEAAAIEKKLQISAFKILGRVEDKKGKIVHFNPRSTPQLRALLLKAGATLRKKTAGQALSTNKHVMGALALRDDKPGRIAKKVIRLRQIAKYISTYLDGKSGNEGFLQHMRDNDRWFPNYNLATARTGRLSADDPPVQTLPRIGHIRDIVIPDRGRILIPHGSSLKLVENNCRLLVVDYNKIELRVMAWLANDGVMTRELLGGVDLHTRMAVTARLMRDPTDEEFARIAPLISKDERGVAKGTNFGVPYGRGAWAIAEANPDSFPADMDMQGRADKVQRVINAYFDKYEGIKRYREDVVEVLRENAQLRTCVFGRVRHLTGVEWFNDRWGLGTSKRDVDMGHMERESWNFEIQALATMILNRQTRRVYEKIKTSRIPCLRMIMTLHDSLIFSCHTDYSEEAVEKIKGWMRVTLRKGRGHKYEMPLVADGAIMRHFGEEYEK